MNTPTLVLKYDPRKHGAEIVETDIKEDGGSWSWTHREPITFPDFPYPTPLKAIRAVCLDCCGGSPKEVRFCQFSGIDSPACPLYPFRLGKNPFLKKRVLSDDHKEKLRKNAKKAAAAKRAKTN